LIAREIEHLSTLLNSLGSDNALKPGSQREWEATTLCASATAKIYTGCERVMTRIATEVDGVKIPKSENWHRALLDRMRQDFPGRVAVITEVTYRQLDKMRAFRHRQRNIYGFDLDTAVVIERAREVITAYDSLVADIRNLLDTLQREASSP
jgi:hypothetical protein